MISRSADNRYWPISTLLSPIVIYTVSKYKLYFNVVIYTVSKYKLYFYYQK